MVAAVAPDESQRPVTPSGAAATEFDLDGDGMISRDELKKGALQFQEVKRKNVGLGVAVGLVSLIVLLLLGVIAGIVGGGASDAARNHTVALACAFCRGIVWSSTPRTFLRSLVYKYNVGFPGSE